MKTTDFHFELPAHLIAQEPLAERSSSRLLCLDGPTGKVTHSQFVSLLEQLNDTDLLVFNNTKVMSARLFGQKQTGGRVEILLERLHSDGTATAQIRASKSPKEGSLIFITADESSDISQLSLRVLGRDRSFFRLAPEIGTLEEMMRQFGHIPLPPYIDRADTLDDRDRYQTVYASREGAVAAPTAGLHFDEAMLVDLASKGIERAFVTLHVGAGTFQPVRVDVIQDHKMHSEWIEVDQKCIEAIERCRARGGRVVAVGTTAVRSLETAAQLGRLRSTGVPDPFVGDSDIFLYPGSEFQVVDAMITNFHLPESTLIMLVAAFAGYEQTMNAYREAVAKAYRFFSYGDAMFVTRNTGSSS